MRIDTDVGQLTEKKKKKKREEFRWNGRTIIVAAVRDARCEDESHRWDRNDNDRAERAWIRYIYYVDDVSHRCKTR